MYRFKYSCNFGLVVVLCLCVRPSHQDLSRLLSESDNFLSPEGYVLNRVQNEWARFKRQQSITADEDSDQDSNDILQSAICGINGKSRKLITEVDTSPAIDWPWMAAVMRRGESESFCGGALINKNYVLTAAHCFVRESEDALQVRLGEYDFEQPDETKFTDFNVTEIRRHPLFDDPTHRFDVALLKLDGVARYSDYIRPICLPKANTDVQTNETVLVAGWGSTAFAEIGSPVLLEVGVPVRDLQQCQDNYGPQVFDQNVCASGYVGSKDSCPGDSGGPLIKQLADGRWVHIGIVSWGKSCGQPNNPGVYTSVRYFVDWIGRNIADAEL